MNIGDKVRITYEGVVEGVVGAYTKVGSAYHGRAELEEATVEVLEPAPKPAPDVPGIYTFYNGGNRGLPRLMLDTNGVWRELDLSSGRCEEVSPRDGTFQTWVRNGLHLVHAYDDGPRGGGLMGRYNYDDETIRDADMESWYEEAFEEDEAYPRADEWYQSLAD